MTGPEHYQEAERLLEEVRGNNTNPQITYAEDQANLAAAQVHATLAVAAASVESAVGPNASWLAAGWLTALTK